MTIERIHAAAPIIERNGYDLIRATALAMTDANAIAKAIASTDMVPKHFRGKPDDLTAAILYGATLGFDPMQSARQVYVIHGQAALYARSMAALVLSAGHEVWTVESKDESVTVSGRRRGSERMETATWTLARAQKAGYTDNAKYRTDPQGMLYAKALSEVCRKIAPDVLNGVYAVEEMQLERVESERVDQPASSVDRMRAALNPSPAPDSPQSAEPDPSPARPSGDDDQASAGEDSPLLNTRSGLAKRMFATIHDAEIAEADRLTEISAIIGRTIGSSKEMTEAEAEAVIATLEVRGPIDVTEGELVDEPEGGDA
jgi:hypothetical protein